MKVFWRIMSLLFVGVMFVVLVPVNWAPLRWGTVPEWICALALLAIAAGLWRLAPPRDGQERLARNEGADLRPPTRRQIRQPRS